MNSIRYTARQQRDPDTKMRHAAPSLFYGTI
jgi:hypothetical protein